MSPTGSGNPKLLFFVTEDWYFCSHRLPLAVAARRAGYDVAVLTRVTDHGGIIRDAGLHLIPLAIDRHGTNPLRDLGLLAAVVRTYRAERPDIVHHVALKPVIYGTVAARIAGVPHVVDAIAGLGFLFTSTGSGARALRTAVERAYRWLLRMRGVHVIVQNPDDRVLLVERLGVRSDIIHLIRGSGVDLERFVPTPEPQGPPVVVLPSRLLRDKGVEEFVGAASSLKAAGVQARFVLVGEPDEGNPGAVVRARLDAWVREGAVEWWGFRPDMEKVLEECNLVCLPSYREGLPKALIEACAAGRAIVTTDVPGCRDVVRDGENGLLIPPRDAVCLADALRRLIGDAQLRRAMGAAGRRIAEREFGLQPVVDQTLEVYRTMLEAP